MRKVKCSNCHKHNDVELLEESNEVVCFNCGFVSFVLRGRREPMFGDPGELETDWVAP